MKRILPILALSLVVLAPVAHAAPSAGDALSDEDYEAAFELVMAGLTLNESCKDILEPKFYEGFKVLFRINSGALGGTDENVKQSEEAAASMAAYLCDGKADCWRSAVQLPATATVEEGRSKCFSVISEILVEIDDILDPKKPAGT